MPYPWRAMAGVVVVSGAAALVATLPAGGAPLGLRLLVLGALVTTVGQVRAATRSSDSAVSSAT